MRRHRSLTKISQANNLNIPSERAARAFHHERLAYIHAHTHTYFIYAYKPYYTLPTHTHMRLNLKNNNQCEKTSIFPPLSFSFSRNYHESPLSTRIVYLYTRRQSNGGNNDCAPPLFLTQSSDGF